MFGRKNTHSEPVANPTGGEKKQPKGGANDVVSEFEQLWSPEETKARKSVEALLQERGIVNDEQLAQAKAVAAQTPGKSMAQILLTMNAASEAQILSALAETLGLAFETPDKSNVNVDAFNLLLPDYIRRQMVLPIRFEGENAATAALVVGMVD